MKYFLLLVIILLVTACSSSSTEQNIELEVKEVTLDSICIYLNEYGDPGWLPEDVNKDGTINVLDMIILAQGVK